MKRYFTFALCLLLATISHAQNYTEYFANQTLRVDYIFTGDASQQSVCLDGLSVLPSWAGRRHQLSELPLQGNGQIIMRDVESGKTIYMTSFSSLFQEWLETDEAQT
ncbi:MAG: peptidase M64, partial [Bacteroides sp.]|nr:peptidase M64 [Bacteroides sp.]